MGIQVSDLLPVQFNWCDIPAGRVTLEAGGYLTAETAFDVPAFAISKYPITNAQFSKFIDAGGYHQPQWWTEEGWRMRTGKKWTQPRDNPMSLLDHPVVGVSWYEASAFCMWLSEISSENILLPTEQQWQRAAQGDDGRIYPWGNEWENHRCNNANDLWEQGAGLDAEGQFSTRIWVDALKQAGRGTTPVTQYEGQGDSPFGVVDLVGNVWEWCMTAYETGINTPQGDALRVLRGGSYLGLKLNARCIVRNRYDPPDYWATHCGFRIVLCDNLFAGITPENLHGETDWGEPVGNEEW